MITLCPPDSGSFDGTQLLWEIPRVVTPLVGEGAAFKSQSLSLGVEGLLLDQHTVSARGFGVVEQGGLVRIRVPFGAEGGYRKVQWIPDSDWEKGFYHQNHFGEQIKG